MKIYEIGTGYTPIPAQMGAATEIVVEELARSFVKNGEDVQIIDIRTECRPRADLPIIEVKVPKLFAKTDVSLGIVHKLKRVIYSIFLAQRIKKILKHTEKNVVLHFHNQYNLFFFLKLTSKKLLRKTTIAYTVHSYIWGADWNEIENIVKKKYFQEIYCVKNADLVFVLNDVTADHFVTKLGVDSERIHKILNGVNVERYMPLSAQKVKALKRENGLEESKVIFQVGSVCERKNQLGTVKMLSKYIKDHDNVVYMYAGGIIDSEYQQAIMQFADENGISDRIRYVGELSPGEQLNDFYNIADCCVFTSKLESFGLVILEAISSGTPIVLSSNLMFALDGDYSMYHTEEEFVLMVDETLKRGKTSRDEYCDFLEKYSWDSVARNYMLLFATNK